MLDKLMTRIGEMQDKAAVRTVFGDPIEVRGRTIIPVARVRYGFGIGTGRAKGGPEREAGEGGGGGGGVSIRPLAVMEITDRGTKFTPIVDVTRLALAGIALIAWNVFWITRTLRVVKQRSRPNP